MSGSDVVNLVGLGCGTLGAFLLGYDVLYRPGARFKAELITTRLDLLRSFRARIRGNIERYSCPPYTPDQIQGFLDEEARQWGPEEAELTSQNNTFLNRYESRVVSFGFLGLCLIFLGFIMQGIAVFVHKPGT
jgi:hypothetical protein